MTELNVKLIKQIRTDDCWIASVKMVVSFFGIDASKIYEISSYIQNPGSASAIKELFQKYNIESNSYEIFIDNLPQLEDIKKSIDEKKPVIVGYEGYNGKINTHAMVIYGYNSNEFIVQDPYNGSMTRIPFNRMNQFTDIVILK